MADRISTEQRSKIMSAIRGKDTKPEVKVRSALHARGLRFRKNDRRYPGSPDVVLPKHNAAVFVNGCFWHAHKGCPGFKMPKSRTEWWSAKFDRTRNRDARKVNELQEAGWRVFTLWDCEISESNIDALVDEIRSGRTNLFQYSPSVKQFAAA